MTPTASPDRRAPLLHFDGRALLFQLGLDRVAASSFDTPAFTACGAPSTRSFASLRPRPVISRTTLMTWIFFAPASLSDDRELGLLFGGRSRGGTAATAPGPRRPPGRPRW